MMRIGTIVIALVTLPFGSLLAGHSEAQTNALVEVLLRSALIRPNFDRQTENIKGGIPACFDANGVLRRRRGVVDRRTDGCV